MRVRVTVCRVWAGLVGVCVRQVERLSEVQQGAEGLVEQVRPDKEKERRGVSVTQRGACPREAACTMHRHQGGFVCALLLAVLQSCGCSTPPTAPSSLARSPSVRRAVQVHS